MPKKYLSSKELGILPEERKALIAFVKSPFEGNIIEVNGSSHFYDQRYTESFAEGCKTAGCVAGYVFAHVRKVQKKNKLRGAKCAWQYFYEAALPAGKGDILEGIYSQNERVSLSKAIKVVKKALKTGKVDWS
jgi:hypothetical protein